MASAVSSLACERPAAKLTSSCTCTSSLPPERPTSSSIARSTGIARTQVGQSCLTKATKVRAASAGLSFVSICGTASCIIAVMIERISSDGNRDVGCAKVRYCAPCLPPPYPPPLAGEGREGAVATLRFAHPTVDAGQSPGTDHDHRDGRTRRPWQDLAGARAHRYRHRPPPGGEGARPHHRSRLRLCAAAGRTALRLRRRAGPPALHQEHAGRRRQCGSCPAGGGG